jgi:hypothetical protein
LKKKFSGKNLAPKIAFKHDTCVHAYIEKRHWITTPSLAGSVKHLYIQVRLDHVQK